MNEVVDYDEGNVYALCPFTRKTCVTHCMLMRRTAFGEPRCSIHVIADELVLLPKEYTLEERGSR